MSLSIPRALASALSRRTLLGLALALGLGLGSPATVTAAEPAVAPAGPALWVVRDEDTTLYLFGTVHFLREGTTWRTDRIDAALGAASGLVLEVADPEDVAAVRPLIQRYGLSPERPLSSLLSAAELARLDGAARTMGGTAAQMEPMRPWLAGVMLSSAPMARAGYQPGSGADMALRAAAAAGGKPVSGLETNEDQIRMLSGFPEEGQLSFLRGVLDEFDRAPVELDRLVEAWARGDLETIAAVSVAPMRARSELLYQAVLVERNQRWADRIAAMLEDPGTLLIAVGVLHLAGEDSVQNLLTARGIAVEPAP